MLPMLFVCLTEPPLCLGAGDDSLIRISEDKLPGDSLALSMGKVWEVIKDQKDLNLPAHKVSLRGHLHPPWLGRVHVSSLEELRAALCLLNTYAGGCTTARSVA